MMHRNRTFSFLLFSALFSACTYTQEFKEGDWYILIIIGFIIFLAILFGAVSKGQDEIYNANIIEGQRHKEAVNEVEDEIRLKRHNLYNAQQELIGYYDRILTDKQKKDPKLVSAKKKFLMIEKEILAAEGKRNQLRKKAP